MGGQLSIFKKQTLKVVKMAIEVMQLELKRNLRLENPNRILIGRLNINSIGSKFEMLTSLITNKRDVLVLSEANTDETFPLEQFLISCFCKAVKIR